MAVCRPYSPACSRARTSLGERPFYHERGTSKRDALYARGWSVWGAKFLEKFAAKLKRHKDDKFACPLHASGSCAEPLALYTWAKAELSCPFLVHELANGQLVTVWRKVERAQAGWRVSIHLHSIHPVDRVGKARRGLRLEWARIKCH